MPALTVRTFKFSFGIHIHQLKSLIASGASERRNGQRIVHDYSGAFTITGSIQSARLGEVSVHGLGP